MFFTKFFKCRIYFSIFKSFFVQKTNSTKETFGVGTLIAIPSSLPLREGIISPIALDAPVAHVLNETFEIEKGFMTTIHAFTSDQRIIDNSHKDPRRARSASQSIVPTSTGASKAIGEIIPSLKGKLEGVAMRVPTPNVSLVELVFCTKKDLSIEKINSAFQNFSKKQKTKVLETTQEKLVSIDFNHNPASSIVDTTLTNVVGKNMGKISAWYDNEWGFSNRMCDIAEYIHKTLSLIHI